MSLKAKIIIIFISTVLICFTHMFCNSQCSETKKVEVSNTLYPFYDAIALDEAHKKEAWKEIKKILSNYAGVEVANSGQAKDKFNENPFLMSFIDECLNKKPQLFEIEVKVEPVIKIPEVLTPTPKNLLSSDVLADTLFELLAECFKEEPHIAYLKKLRDKLKESDLPLLFPNAKDFLVSSKIFRFKLFVPNLKAAFQKDLYNWDSNLYAFLEKKKNDNIDNIKTSSELNIVFYFLNLIKNIRAGVHPADIIDNPSGQEYLVQLSNNFSNPIRLLSLVSRNLRDKNGKGWIKPEKFKILIENGGKELRNLFIGLIYARESAEMGKIVFNKKSLKTIIFENQRKIKEINEHLHNVILLAEKIENQISKVRNLEEGKDTSAKYRLYMESVVDFVELGSDITKMFEDETIPNKIDEFIKKARIITAIVDNVLEKQYRMAIKSTSALLNDILKNDSNSVMKYMTYAVDIVTAEDAKEILTVLGEMTGNDKQIIKP